jgi:hypothetical protein
MNRHFAPPPLGFQEFSMRKENRCGSIQCYPNESGKSGQTLLPIS